MINNKMINIGLLVVAIISLIVFVFNRPLQELIDKLFFKKLINIEIVDDTEMSFSEIGEYCKKNRIDNFSMNLDDSMSDLYNVVKIKIHNKGVSVDGNIAIKLKIDNKYTKIIDIQIPIAVESNSFSHGLPEWIWDDEKASKKDHRLKFSWRPAKEDDVIGYRLYSSRFEDVGFALIGGSSLIECCEYSFLFKEKGPLYYAMDTVDQNGLSSVLSSPIFVDWPQHLEYEPFYQDINNTVDINTNEQKFFKGEVVFNLLKGLKKGQIVNVYSLYKSIPADNEKMDLEIINRNDIEVIISKIQNSKPEGKNKKNYEDQKEQITPRKVSYFLGKRKLIITWGNHVNEPRNYTDVVIYKNQYKKNRYTGLGKELYLGPGLDKTYICVPKEKKVTEIKSKRTFSVKERELILIPDKPPETIIWAKNNTTPMPPVFASLELNSDVKGVPRKLYYVDEDVISEESYLYTLYGIDKKFNYSYPVSLIINFNLDSADVICDVVEINHKSVNK